MPRNPSIDRASDISRRQRTDLLASLIGSPAAVVTGVDTIAVYGGQCLSKAGLDRNAICYDRAPREDNYFVDCRIEIKVILSRRRFLDVITDPVDYVSRSVGIAQDTAERFPDLAQVWRLPV